MKTKVLIYRKRKLPALYFFFLIFLGISYSLFSASYPVTNGVLDLRFWDGKSVDISGDWKIYRNKFYTNISDIDEAGENIFVPGSWKGASFFGGKRMHGYATYHLRVLTQTNEVFAIRLKEIISASRGFINGELLFEQGFAGTNKETTINRNEPVTRVFHANSRVVDIMLLVSSFDDRVGGIIANGDIGRVEDVFEKRSKQIMLDMLVFGALMIMAVYHFVLFLLNPQNKSTIYLSFFCALFAIKGFTEGERLYTMVVQNPGFDFLVNAPYLCYYLAMPSIVLFFYSIFSSEMNETIMKVVVSVQLIFAFIGFVFPYQILVKTLNLYSIWTLVSVPWLLSGVFIALFNKKRDALILIMGFMILLAGGINDILYSNQIIVSAYLVPLAMVFFMLFESILLSYRFARAFHAVDKFSKELHKKNESLKDLNRLKDNFLSTLEQKVQERTIQLDIARIEAENANLHKSKFLANMSHELRTPLNAINGIADLLRFGSYEQTETVYHEIGSLIDTLKNIYESGKDDYIKNLITRLEEFRVFLDEDGNAKRYWLNFEKKHISSIPLKEKYSKEFGEIEKRIYAIEEAIEAEERDMLKAYTQIKDSGDYLLGLISTVLNLAKVESGKIEIDLEKLNLHDLLNSVLESAKSYAIAKNKEMSLLLRAEVDENLDETIMLDKQKISQVLLNFLSNAIKFSDKGEVVLRVSSEGNGIKFSVSDRGIGIKDEEKHKIFSEFGRTKESSDIDGTGLGLSLSKKLIEMLEGQIGFESSYQKGSVFWFVIPKH